MNTTHTRTGFRRDHIAVDTGSLSHVKVHKSRRSIAAALLALALAGCSPSVDQSKVDAVAACVEETRPMVQANPEDAADWLEYCGWHDLNDAEQAAAKAAL